MSPNYAHLRSLTLQGEGIFILADQQEVFHAA